MKASATAREQLEKNPARFIRQEISRFVRQSAFNRLPFLDDYIMWDTPLIRFADGNDPLFQEYKSIISAQHLTPREALAESCHQKPEALPRQLSVISWVLPARKETRQAQRLETRAPSRLWSHSRWYGEIFNDRLREHVSKLLKDAGYQAMAPVIQPYFRTFDTEQGLCSNWSERHVAYAAGHGTFSLSDGFITERGIAHRCGSVVTSLVLPVSRRQAKSPYENCLFYAGIACRACINRCPAGAISEKGHDKKKCRKYLADLGYLSAAQKGVYDIEKSVAGCGLCQANVPCEFENPVRKLAGKLASD
jgi:epoxyqueuosine reductase QueG